MRAKVYIIYMRLNDATAINNSCLSKQGLLYDIAASTRKKRKLLFIFLIEELLLLKMH